MQRVEVADLGQFGDDRHEDDDRRDGIDEVADDHEQHHQKQHDHRSVGAREAGDVGGHDVGPAQVRDHPAERRGAGHRRQRQRIKEAGVHEVARQFLDVRRPESAR